MIHLGTTRNGRFRLDRTVAPGKVYRVRVVPRTRAGSRQALHRGAYGTVGARGPVVQPPDVTGLAWTITGGHLTLEWDCSLDPTIAGYEIRYGASWDGGVILADCHESNVYTAPLFLFDQLPFWVRAKDAYGVVSDKAAMVNVEVKPGDAVIDAQASESPTWPGEKTNLNLQGSELIMADGATTATYTSQPLSATLQARFRLWARFNASLVPRDLLGAECCLLGNRPWVQRTLGVDAGTADWESQHNLDWDLARGALTLGNGAYANQLGALRADYSRFATYVLEMRWSTNNQSSWTPWEPWTVKAVDFVTDWQWRVTINTALPVGDLIPRLTQLDLYNVHATQLATEPYSNEGGLLPPRSFATLGSGQLTGDQAITELAKGYDSTVGEGWPTVPMDVAGWCGAGNRYSVTNNTWAVQLPADGLALMGYLVCRVPTTYVPVDETDQIRVRIHYWIGGTLGPGERWQFIGGFREYVEGSVPVFFPFIVADVIPQDGATAGMYLQAEVKLPFAGFHTLAPGQLVEFQLGRFAPDLYPGTVSWRGTQIFDGSHAEWTPTE